MHRIATAVKLASMSQAGNMRIQLPLPSDALRAHRAWLLGGDTVAAGMT